MAPDKIQFFPAVYKVYIILLKKQITLFSVFIIKAHVMLISFIWTFHCINMRIKVSHKKNVLWDMGLLLYSVRITSHFTALQTDEVSSNM